MLPIHFSQIPVSLSYPCSLKTTDFFIQNINRWVFLKIPTNLYPYYPYPDSRKKKNFIAMTPLIRQHFCPFSHKNVYIFIDIKTPLNTYRYCIERLSILCPFSHKTTLLSVFTWIFCPFKHSSCQNMTGKTFFITYHFMTDAHKTVVTQTSTILFLISRPISMHRLTVKLFS